MKRRTRLIPTLLVALGAFLVGGCDEGREVNNPFGGPTHGPERYAGPAAGSSDATLPGVDRSASSEDERRQLIARR